MVGHLPLDRLTLRAGIASLRSGSPLVASHSAVFWGRLAVQLGLVLLRFFFCSKCVVVLSSSRDSCLLLPWWAYSDLGSWTSGSASSAAASSSQAVELELVSSCMQVSVECSPSTLFSSHGRHGEILLEDTLVFSWHHVPSFASFHLIPGARRWAFLLAVLLFSTETE